MTANGSVLVSMPVGCSALEDAAVEFIPARNGKGVDEGCGERRIDVARMPKYEKIRNERDRAHQKKSLGVPKRNVVLAVINSGFFLWLLSAALLTGGGGYITNHQECMREANQLIQRRSLVSEEMFGRLVAYLGAIHYEREG